MKFLHIADLHLGKMVHNFRMLDDQEYMLGKLLKVVDERKIDTVLIAGDVYDQSIPSEGAVRLFDEFLCELAGRKVNTFIISGNHDSGERLGFGRRLFASNDIHICTKYQGRLEKHTVMDETGPVHIYLLPYLTAAQIRNLFPDEIIRSYEDAIRVILKGEDIDTSQRNILVAHQFVTAGGMGMEFSGSESRSREQVGTVEMIHADCFEAFDYVALGHIHSSYAVAWDTIRYSGSLLKYSASEAGHKKSFPVGIMGGKGDIQLEEVSPAPKHDVRCLRGGLKQLLAEENRINTEDYVFVTLTDENPVMDVIGTIRQYYPNVMQVSYDNTYSNDRDSFDFNDYQKRKNFDELIKDFFMMMYDREMDEKDLRLMKEIAREAGVTDETN